MEKRKIPVAILGATGMVGQRFIELLADHPWFEIVALTASERSIGKKYGQAVTWLMQAPLPTKIALMTIEPTLPNLPCEVVFSALDSKVAGEVESAFSKAGYFVISNCSNHRMDESVPLLIPEVNPSHLALIDQKLCQERGVIVTNPNCSAVGIAMALKPILDIVEIESAFIVTLQAISGAGYPGVAAFDITDNVIPHIQGEEHKIQTELPKIFGSLDEKGSLRYHPLKISAHCNRVPVTDGHMACISIKLKGSVTKENIIQGWKTYRGAPQRLNLPTAPAFPIVYLEERFFPQPKKHRDLGKGMTVAIGRLQPCNLLDWKFTILSHNTIRGAAGGALLNAELMLKQGFFSRLRSFAYKLAPADCLL